MKNLLLCLIILLPVYCNSQDTIHLGRVWLFHYDSDSLLNEKLYILDSIDIKLQQQGLDTIHVVYSGVALKVQSKILHGARAKAIASYLNTQSKTIYYIGQGKAIRMDSFDGMDPEEMLPEIYLVSYKTQKKP